MFTIDMLHKKRAATRKLRVAALVVIYPATGSRDRGCRSAVLHAPAVPDTAAPGRRSAP